MNLYWKCLCSAVNHLCQMVMWSCNFFEGQHGPLMSFLPRTMWIIENCNPYISGWYGSTQHWIQFYILFLVMDSKWNYTKQLTKWDGFYRLKVTTKYLSKNAILVSFRWHFCDIIWTQFLGNIHSLQNGLHNSKLSHLYSFSQRNFTKLLHHY